MTKNPFLGQAFTEITITQGIKKFPTYLYTKGKSRATHAAYMSDLKLFSEFRKKFYPHIRYAHEVHPAMLLEFQIYLMDLVKNEKLSTKTAKRKYNAIRTLFRFFEEGCHLLVNPLKGCTFGNKSSRGNYAESGDDIIKYIEQDDIGFLVDSIRRECRSVNKFRDIAMVETLRYTGCRASEVIGLRWCDINFYDQTIMIFRQKNNTYDELPAHENILEALLDYKKSLPADSPNKEFIFSTRQSKQISKSVFNAMFRKHVAASGLEEKYKFGITPHTLRHSFVMHMLKNGVPTVKIMKFTGHSSEKELAPYIHLVPNDLKGSLDFFH